MSKIASATLLVLMVSAVILLTETQETVAMTCNPLELSSCASAITSSVPPSRQCCSKLREQIPCLCQYESDPTLSQYVNSPGARRVASTCGVSIQC